MKPECSTEQCNVLTGVSFTTKPFVKIADKAEDEDDDPRSTLDKFVISGEPVTEPAATSSNSGESNSV